MITVWDSPAHQPPYTAHLDKSAESNAVHALHEDKRAANWAPAAEQHLDAEDLDNAVKWLTADLVMDTEKVGSPWRCCS